MSSPIYGYPASSRRKPKQHYRETLTGLYPYLWRSEFRNVLTTYVRAKRLAANDAQTIYLGAEDMVRGREYAVTGRTALDLAFASNMSAYDCEYVALADEFNCKLVSSDRKLVKAFSKRAILLSDFVR